MQVFACNLMRKHLLAKYFTINFQQYFLLPHYRTNPTNALTVLRLGSVKFCLFLYVCCIKMAIFLQVYQIGIKSLFSWHFIPITYSGKFLPLFIPAAYKINVFFTRLKTQLLSWRRNMASRLKMQQLRLRSGLINLIERSLKMLHASNS